MPLLEGRAKSGIPLGAGSLPLDTSHSPLSTCQTHEACSLFMSCGTCNTHEGTRLLDGDDCSTTPYSPHCYRQSLKPLATPTRILESRLLTLVQPSALLCCPTTGIPRLEGRIKLRTPLRSGTLPLDTSHTPANPHLTI